MIKPWRVVRTAPLHRDRWLDVRADHCVTEGGHAIGPYYVLRYPDFVHAVALTDAGEIVLVEQYRHAAAAVTLELPGGMMEREDGDPATTAARELREETGYAAANVRLVSSMFVNPATHTNQIHAVLATGCTLAGPPALEGAEEGLAVRVMPVAALLAELPHGGLRHSMQIACLLLGLRAAGLSWP